MTTVNAVLQRVPERRMVSAGALSAASGNVVPMEDLVKWLESNGFSRSTTVREPGEYAVRGGILDLFAGGQEAPVRLDFFGDTLESIRTFDPETQRTVTTIKRFELTPIAEMSLTREFDRPLPPELCRHLRRGGPG